MVWDHSHLLSDCFLLGHQVDFSLCYQMIELWKIYVSVWKSFFTFFFHIKKWYVFLFVGVLTRWELFSTYIITLFWLYCMIVKSLTLFIIRKSLKSTLHEVFTPQNQFCMSSTTELDMSKSSYKVVYA